MQYLQTQPTTPAGHDKVLAEEAKAAHQIADILRSLANMLDSVALHPTFHPYQLIPLLTELDGYLDRVNLQANRLRCGVEQARLAQLRETKKGA